MPTSASDGMVSTTVMTKPYVLEMPGLSWVILPRIVVSRKWKKLAVMHEG